MIREAVFYAELGNRLQKRRKAMDMTQEELADKVGLTRTSITNIEKGRQKVLAHLLVQLGEALDIPISELVEKDNTTAQAMEALPQSARQWIETAVKTRSHP